jgi:hypothetical protein
MAYRLTFAAYVLELQGKTARGLAAQLMYKRQLVGENNYLASTG